MADISIIKQTTPPSSSKRRSFNPGPRPLQLALSTNSASLPGSPPLSSTPYTSSPSPGVYAESPLSARVARAAGNNARRQSSISYFAPRDGEGRTSLRPSPTGAKHGLTRSVSVGNKTPLSPPGVGSARGASPGDRRSTGSVESAQSEKSPHTLAEKHADLLQFIAQKESKCLELRSQLATHEAELLQLKRKWERIVNRGFERSNGINEYSPPGSSANAAAQQQGGAMLEGIREGVQGVSRFIAAGLVELTPAQPSSSTSSPATKTTALRQSHSTQPSSSSVSTFATNSSKSTRLSQSSASSLGEDPTHPEEECEQESVDGETEQILMVRDTGATPTMSPNPVFVRKHNSGPIEVGSSTRDSVSPVGAIHRRKSRDANTPPPLSTSTSSSSANGKSKPYDLSTSPTAESAAVKKTLKAKRMSGTGLPPPVSIPGLGSLTNAVGNGGGQPVSSWMGNMGKKWEEIQKGSTFTKGQKRASVLLDNLSQNLASALTSPPLASASYNPLAEYHTHTTSSSAASQSTTPLQSSSSVSLLDDDDTVTANGGPALGDVMKPSPVSAQPAAQVGANSSVAGKDTSVSGQTLDDDEEWGW